jgi:hypothetical protein
MSVKTKQDLITRLDAYVEENENQGVASQQNAIFARTQVKPVIDALTGEQGLAVAAAISAAEYYDPEQDRFEFGPRKVSPADYGSFLKDLNITIDVDLERMETYETD